MEKQDFSSYPLSAQTERIINACIEVQKELGPGFLEAVYKDALEIELRNRGIVFQIEKRYIVKYKGVLLSHHYIADLVINDSIIVELKARSAICDEDLAQTINYLKCSDCKVGLIINFGTVPIGIRRVIL